MVKRKLIAEYSDIISDGKMDPRNKPSIDEIIAKVQTIGEVGHMFYVKQRVEEAVKLLQALKDA